MIPSSLTLRGVTFSPALFCAPMAGLTHSAFRRLVADFGGYGALFTEMLSGKWLLHENLQTSASVKRRPHEGQVIYQLMITDAADVAPIMGRLAEMQPAAIDLNCACPAPNIRAVGAGSELFEDPERLGAILKALRAAYAGPLLVKIRLGNPRDGWRERLAERFRLFEDCGIDAMTLHPRFSDEKLKRRARHELYGELVAMTRLPIIASGDILGPQTVAEQAAHFGHVSGIMLGRIAVVQPWLFRNWPGNAYQPDYLEVWTRLFEYVCEDFIPTQAIRRLKLLTMYYARNFKFGHSLFAATQSATDLPTLRARGTAFLAGNPELVSVPATSGLA